MGNGMMSDDCYKFTVLKPQSKRMCFIVQIAQESKLYKKNSSRFKLIFDDDLTFSFHPLVID